jgi:hypothetical protein
MHGYEICVHLWRLQYVHSNDIFTVCELFPLLYKSVPWYCMPQSNFGQGRFYIFRLRMLILAAVPLYTQIKFMVWPEKGTELMANLLRSCNLSHPIQVKPFFLGPENNKLSGFRPQRPSSSPHAVLSHRYTSFNHCRSCLSLCGRA